MIIRNAMKMTLAIAVAASLPASDGHAAPSPGSVFREYTYTNARGDAGGSIRVGGKRGVSYPDRGSDFDYVNAWIPFPHEVDLKDAVHAEIIVEKILSHNGTTGFAIQWNDSPWIDLPEPTTIPAPRHEYYHHTCITVPISIDELEGDEGSNRFRLRVSPEQSWNWPQHLVYGVHLRVYYAPEKKRHVGGRITVPQSGGTLGTRVSLAVEISDRYRRIDRVDYLGLYEGVNWEGDGNFRQWHAFYYHGKLIHHIGSSVVAPFDLSWDTSWIPDQSQPIQLAARLVDDTGLIYMTQAVKDLTLERPGLSVELCKPNDVPRNWVTRNGEHQQTVSITGDLAKASAAQLVWSSWSPGYMNGVYVNGHVVVQSEGPKYRYFDHVVTIDRLSILKPGKNTISTGKTPLYDGQMVHGMEVNWPGMQLLIQYRDERPKSVGLRNSKTGHSTSQP